MERRDKLAEVQYFNCCFASMRGTVSLLVALRDDTISLFAMSLQLCVAAGFEVWFESTGLLTKPCNAVFHCIRTVFADIKANT